MSTRDRILECSRELFFSRSFSRVSLKDIAAAAGVSAPLIIKHFQTKENLFEQTVDFSLSAIALFDGPFECLGRTAITETLNAPVHAHYSMIRVLTVADGTDDAIHAIGRRIKEDLLSVLTERIRNEAPHPSSNPQLRAQSAMALLVGLSFMRRVGDVEFEAMDTEQLIAHYSQILQGILDGPLG